MRAIAFYKKTSLSSAVGIGFLASAAAYNAGTAYAVADRVTYNSKTWACVVAGTGNTPSSTSAYWIEVDSTYGIPTNALYAMIQCETQAIRWRDDGIAPTASVGQLLPVAAASTQQNSLLYNYGPLWRIKIIEVTGSAVANITFYGA